MSTIARWQRTSDDKLTAVIRLLVGLIFVAAGILKVAVPALGEAFSGQLAAAAIPLSAIVEALFPFVETALGLLLILGYHSRLIALAGAGSMLVATYVHIAVDDPSLFPLQPVEPIGPLMLIAMLLYTVKKGAGAWSWDLKQAGTI